MHLSYIETIVEAKVMETLWLLEEKYPLAGKALVATFFTDTLWPREQLLWAYAARRAEAYKHDVKRLKGAARPWDMPPIRRLDGAEENDDIPLEGPLVTRVDRVSDDAAVAGAGRPGVDKADHVIDVIQD
jgi:hypothetical protein